MFSKMKIKNLKLNKVNSIIGPELTIEGIVCLDAGTLKVAGRINGDITSIKAGKVDVTVVVEKDASVKSESIHVDNLVVVGAVKVKKLIVRNILAVMDGGNLICEDGSYKTLVVSENSAINGNLKSQNEQPNLKNPQHLEAVA